MKPKPKPIPYNYPISQKKYVMSSSKNATIEQFSWELNVGERLTAQNQVCPQAQ